MCLCIFWNTSNCKTPDRVSLLINSEIDKPGLYTKFSIPILYFFSACFKNLSNLSPPAEKVVRTQKSNSGQSFGSFGEI